MEELDAERSLNSTLKPCLEKAHAHMKLDQLCTKENVAILENVLEDLRKSLIRTDELFGAMFNRFVYSGSYYDSLRIRAADEFDINVVFTLPTKRYFPFKLKRSSASGAFLACRVSKPALRDFASCGWTKALAKFFHEQHDGYCWLSMTQVRQWFQSLLDRLPRLKNVEGVLDGKYGASGPARTLHIRTRNGRFDVDLVPVLEMPNENWPELLGTNRKVLTFMKKNGIDLSRALGCLVPKEHQPDNSPFYWRAHFPYVERDLMNDSGCLKPTIRLLKLLRDSQGWHQISSYALKTLVIWCTMDSSADYWEKQYHGVTFYKTLQRLQEALRGRGIPYLYSPDVNLLQHCSAESSKNYARAIARILRRVKEDPTAILGCLGVPTDGITEAQWESAGSSGSGTR